MVVFDTKEDDFRTVVKDYQEVSLKYLWRLGGGGASSRDVWVNVNKDLMGKRTISRASIINFLNSMVDEGVLNYTEITGKGGHRRIYTSKYDEAGFKKHMAKNVISKMLETWPEATRAALEAIKVDK
ncbi:unnamed protein product [marine sediment metagenome]|uniref:Uncharacterized protein n=1 Tax=marine sediment metagenome TaxID=412755 RepID=X1JKN3_9ZZZZ